MKHKKVFSVLLTGALLFSQTPVSHGADSAFPDLAGHWAESVMLQAYQNQLLLGENGRMNPDGTLTRAQLAAIVNRAFGAVDEAPMDTYTDVAPGKWYAKDMARALKMGTLAGSGTKMMPEAPVTREQAMTVLARALALEDGTATDLGAFVDASQLSTWALGPVSAMARAKYATGANGRLSPQATITRAETAALLAKIVSTYAKTSLNGTTVTGNLMVNAPNVTIANSFLEGNLWLGDGARGTQLMDVSVQGDLLMRGGEALTLSGSTAITGTLRIPDLGHEVAVTSSSNLPVPELVAWPAVTLSGGYTDVTVYADAHILSGGIQKLNVNTEGLSIAVETGVMVRQVNVNKNNTAITGTGVINVILAPGVTGTTLNGVPLTSSLITNSTSMT